MVSTQRNQKSRRGLANYGRGEEAGLYLSKPMRKLKWYCLEESRDVGPVDETRHRKKWILSVDLETGHSNVLGCRYDKARA